MELIATIEDPNVAQKILDHRGESSRAPPRGHPSRIRDPAELEPDAGAPPSPDAEWIDPPAFDEQQHPISRFRRQARPGEALSASPVVALQHPHTGAFS